MKKLFSLLLLFTFFFAWQPAQAKTNLVNKLSGKTLVAVESAGEIWYVNPVNKKRYYLGKPNDFLQSMRKLALGVSDKDFNSFHGWAPRRLAGRFLLLVDQGGAIAYVHPKTLKIFKFKNINDAIESVKSFSLGINNNDLQKIEIEGEETKAVENVATTKEKKVEPAKVNNFTDSEKKIKKIAEDFINDNLLQNGRTAVISEIAPVYGLYELKVKISGSDKAIISYISQDGKKFFPQALDVTAQKKQTTTEKKQTAVNNKVNKTKKPNVELFVMSYCPYGTQIEKGIIPVVKALGDNIDFQIKFVDYAMHGKKELDENLRQYCLQKEQGDKYLAYLDCFLQSQDSETCLSNNKVDVNKLNTCVSTIDKQYKVSSNYEDDSTWLNGHYPRFDIQKDDNEKYGVQGSPTLVLNGKQVSSNRDANSLLTTICNTFITKPQACSTKLSSTTPSPGFGGGSTTSSGGGCGQ